MKNHKAYSTECTRQQIRDFAHQLDATSFILRRLESRTAHTSDTVNLHKLRDIVDGLQGSGGGRPAFEISFLSLARRLRHIGRDETAETYAQRKVAALDKGQRKASRLLFTIHRGGGVEHRRTRYVDHLTPVANWMMQQARESDLWAEHPAKAIEAFVDEAVEMLPEAEDVKAQEQVPIEDNLYIQRMVKQGINYALKACDRAAEIGGDDISIARMAAERLLRSAANRHNARGVQICIPRALEYAARGIPVFPVKESKAPYTRRGFKDATCDTATIRNWWRKWPDAGIGVPTGVASGWLVLDSDPRHGGDASLSQLIEEHGDLPETLEAETGGGGHHIVFEYPELAELGNSRGRLPEGLDVRGEGGYIVVAPSLHASGRRYCWRNDLRPAPVPEWLLMLLTEERPAPFPTLKHVHRAKAARESGL